jgi:RNA polymerase sigma-70 factor (ECF subfamily)
MAQKAETGRGALTTITGFTRNTKLPKAHAKVGSNSMSQLPDAALTALFEQQVLPLTNYMYAMALGMTHNRTDAEDLVQETTIKAYRSFSSFEQGTALRAWLRTIMRNTNSNIQAKKNKQLGKTALDELEDWQIGAAPSLTSVENRSAEIEAIEAMNTPEIERALAELPESWRQVLTYRIVEGMSYAEIAEALDMKQGTVMSSLHRAKARLRELLLEYAKDEGYSFTGKDAADD